MPQDPEMAARTEALTAELKAEGALKLTRAEAWEKHLCIKCVQPPPFTTPAGQKEYWISAMCEPCFDAMWPESPDA